MDIGFHPVYLWIGQIADTTLGSVWVAVSDIDLGLVGAPGKMTDKLSNNISVPTWLAVPAHKPISPL